MKTIKIIDLLNKIARGEEVPQKIRIGALYMYWDGSVYWDEDGESQFCEVIGSSEYSLNREVEIIEEEKEIEKLGYKVEQLENPNHNESLLMNMIRENKETINKLIEELKRNK